jgi:hypothetical protein
MRLFTLMLVLPFVLGACAQATMINQYRNSSGSGGMIRFPIPPSQMAIEGNRKEAERRMLEHCKGAHVIVVETAITADGKQAILKFVCGEES